MGDDFDSLNMHRRYPTRGCGHLRTGFDVLLDARSFKNKCTPTWESWAGKDNQHESASFDYFGKSIQKINLSSVPRWIRIRQELAKIWNKAESQASGRGSRAPPQMGPPGSSRPVPTPGALRQMVATVQERLIRGESSFILNIDTLLVVMVVALSAPLSVASVLFNTLLYFV